MRRRALYNSSENVEKIEGKPIENATYSDVCFYNTETYKYVISSVGDIHRYVSSNYSLIGVVVVPSLHNYGRPKLVSINDMSCAYPTTGTESGDDIMSWGNYVDDLTPKNALPYIGTSYDEVTKNGIVNFINGDETISLPSDSFGIGNPSNTNEGFFTSKENYYMCSPYKQDGSKDERYFSTSNTGNVLADIYGRSNTNKILEQRGYKDYSSWIPSHIEDTDYPPASCCDMYSNVGAGQGSWYLPSIGELGYLLARKDAIENSLNNLKNYGFQNIKSDLEQEYWSSTQYNAKLLSLNLYNGNLDVELRNVYKSVRAFCAL